MVLWGSDEPPSSQVTELGHHYYNRKNEKNYGSCPKPEGQSLGDIIKDLTNSLESQKKMKQGKKGGMGLK